MSGTLDDSSENALRIRSCLADQDKVFVIQHLYMFLSPDVVNDVLRD